MTEKDPSDNACIEQLKVKTVPDGLVALGTIIQVTEFQLKLQITGGIICIVDRFSVSEIYRESLEKSVSSANPGGVSPLRLTQMFKRGQQYTCKVIERRPRKGYPDAQDIIATLDPSFIHEDTLPKTYLAIPQVPVQCVVSSIEDHGYQIDLGFKGITGFLDYDESEEYCAKHNGGKKFSIGQIIKCCLKKPLDRDNETRVVQLSMTKEDMKASKFSQEKVMNHEITPRCILPGSQSFLTVMKVHKNGLIVNFMNEFAGFVGKNHLKDQWHVPKSNYKISDTFECTVLYYNHITNLFALSIVGKKQYNKTLRDFLKSYHIGQTVKATVAYLEDTKAVTFKINKSYKAIANVRDALNEDVSVMTKDELHVALDSAFPDHSKHKCRIKSINLTDLIIIVSLRQDFIELPHVSVEELRAGDHVEATVKKHVKDGVIVVFGLNLRAIILNSDLHDYVSAKSYNRYPIGKKIKCRILKVDSSKQPPRVYLTNKEKLMSNDLMIVDSYDASLMRKSTQGTVSKIREDGIIVEFFNNIKGLAPRRFLSSVPIKNVSDTFTIGQVVSCTIYKADPERRRLKLGLVSYDTIVAAKAELKRSKAKKREMKRLAKEDRVITKQINRKQQEAAKRSKKVDIHDEFGKSDKTDFDNDGEMKKRDEYDSDDITKANKKNPNTGKRPATLNDSLTNKSAKRCKFLETDSGINWSAGNGQPTGSDVAGHGLEGSDDSDDDDDGSSTSSSATDDDNSEILNDENAGPVIKSRRQRSEDAKKREEKLRETERQLLDPNRQPQSIADFERLTLKDPNSADIWIKYSKFFVDNVETEKARIVCRRALRTINFRMDKEKLKVWLHLIKIEARYGGLDKFRETLEEAAQTNDKLQLYRGTVKVLVSCNQLEEAEKYLEMMIKLSGRSVDVWIEFIQFYMDSCKDLAKARALFDKATKSLMKSDLVTLRSRFAQCEFRFGDVERGKTMFENLLSDNPKRTDLWKVYEGMIRKFGLRQLDTEEVREQNEQILQRIKESVELVSKKARKKVSV